MLILLPGRTGRMGQRGIATSFYTERDEPIASVLVRTLLETKQEVPEFLQSFMPTGKGLENLKFETESDFDPEEAGIAHLGGGGDGGWSNEGYGDNAESAVAGADNSAWGASGNNAGWGDDAPDDSGNDAKDKKPEVAPAWGAAPTGDSW